MHRNIYLNAECLEEARKIAQEIIIFDRVKKSINDPTFYYFLNKQNEELAFFSPDVQRICILGKPRVWDTQWLESQLEMQEY